MKSTKTKMGLLVAAALMNMSHTAKAQSSMRPIEKFIPLEQLPAEERAKYEQLIHDLESVIRIDWESVILGVDENGKLVLRSRSVEEMKHLANPSCWTAPY